MNLKTLKELIKQLLCNRHKLHFIGSEKYSIKKTNSRHAIGEVRLTVFVCEKCGKEIIITSDKIIYKEVNKTDKPQES